MKQFKMICFLILCTLTLKGYSTSWGRKDNNIKRETLRLIEAERRILNDHEGTTSLGISLKDAVTFRRLNLSELREFYEGKNNLRKFLEEVQTLLIELKKMINSFRTVSLKFVV